MFITGTEVSMSLRPRESTQGLLSERRVMRSLVKGYFGLEKETVVLRTAGQWSDLPEQPQKCSHNGAYKE